MNHSRVMRSGYTRFRGVPGVRSHVNDEWRLVEIGRSIESACGVESEVFLNYITERGNTRFICRVSLEYVSRVSGYDTSTRYRLDCLSIPG